MKRRQFLTGALAGTAITTLDWLRFFRSFGVPGTKKELGIAEAAAAELAATPHFLIYWFQEGGWDGYAMFNPLDTRNDATLVIPAGTLNPSPSWTDQLYRPSGYGTPPNDPPITRGNITYGFLASDGMASLANDLAVVSSHHGNEFHSGGRWDYHYGKYSHSLSASRGDDERTVMQAFCEAYGASTLLPNVSWHRWLADGELSLANYPEGTGYYEKLGPPYAHTIYGKLPEDMRNRLRQIQGLTANARDARIRTFVDALHRNFVADKNSESVKAFASAVQIHQSLVGGQVTVDPNAMFTDSALRSEFNIQPADETTSAAVINGNPARSKETPNTNVQAMMAYELMTKGLSIGFWIESRDVRGFDTHFPRRGVFQYQNPRGQQNQLARMKADLWSPLLALVARLKSTQHPVTGKSYWDHTTIVLASEMGRMMNADAGSILQSSATDADKYSQIMDQDVCQHWLVSSAAFLGGTVQGNRQWGRVGTVTQDAIPLMPDGTLDPAFDPLTGLLRSGATQSPNSVVSDCGHVYATALYLSGLDPDGLRTQGKGKNTSGPLRFIKR
ncbi:MAG: hypothetical protein ACXWK8_05615 [Myxococcaceae bacterium]